MFEAFFGFKKSPFSDSPDAKQFFASQAATQIKARLQFLVDHRGAGLLADGSRTRPGTRSHVWGPGTSDLGGHRPSQ
jgi:hypothetical protein